MIASKLFRRIITIVYLCGAALFLSSCANNANSDPQNRGIGEEYGTSDPGWR